MYFQVGPRGSGKTRALIERMMKLPKPWIVVVADKAQEWYVLNIASALGALPGEVRIATISDYRRVLAGRMASVVVDHSAIEMAVNMFLGDIAVSSGNPGSDELGVFPLGERRDRTYECDADQKALEFFRQSGERR